MRKTRVLLLVLVALFVGFLTACTSTEDLLNAAKDELVANYDATIASETYQVTGNLTLVTEIADATVSWTSSNTAIITNAGVVTRPQTDTQVTLTATLTIDGETITHQFRVTVKAAEVTVAQKLEAAKALLVTNYASTIGDDEYVVTADLTLVTTIGEATVSWASSDEAIITTAGVVAAPAFSVGDQTVTLTATLTISGQTTTQIFYAFVEAAAETVSERLDRALAFVTTFPAVEGITGVEDWIEFPTSVEFEGTTYTVSWVSNKPNFLAVDGTVTRPEVNTPNEKVIMTATITEGTVTRSMEVEFIVFAIESSTLLDSIGEVYSFESGDYVKFEGVTVIGKMLYGFFISDGTTVLYIYDSSTLYDFVKVGETYDIEGVYDLYYGLPQLANNASRPLTATPSDAAPVSLTGTPATVDSAIGNKPTPSNNAPMVYNYLSITAKVLVDGQETTDIGRYNTFLVDPTYTGTTIITEMNTDGKAISYATDGIIIYYQSLNKAAVEVLDGKLVTMNILLYGYRSDRMIWYAIYLGDGTDIQATFDTDAEAVAAVKNSLVLPASIIKPTTLNLIDAQHGTTITWASDNEQVIDPATGVVAPIEGQQVTVTLTATIEKGTVVDTKVFTIKVGELPVSTVAQVVAAANSVKLRVQGIMVVGDMNRTYFVHDETGALTVYTSDSALLNIMKTNLGKQVDIIGTKNQYGEFVPESVVVLGNAVDSVVKASIDGVAFTVADLTPYRGKLISATGLLVKSNTTDTYGNVLVELTNLDGEVIKVYYTDYADLDVAIVNHLAGFAVGSVVNLVDIPMGWYSNAPRLYYSATSQVVAGTLTDNHKVVLDAAAIVVPATVTEAGTLTLPATGTNGSAIAWVSNNVLIDATTGAVTLPASGQETVTLTATVTLNSAEKVVTFDVLVGVPPVSTETLAYSFDFESSSLTTSYVTSTTATVNNLVTSTNANMSIARVAGNTSSVTGATKAAVISPRIGSGYDGKAFVEFNFGTETIVKLEFDMYFWSGTAEQYFTKYELQVWNSTTSTWETHTNLLSLIAGKLTIENIVISGFTSSQFRFYAEGGKDGGNDARVLLDNLKLYK
jgi:hypothetical protein